MQACLPWKVSKHDDCYDVISSGVPHAFFSDNLITAASHRGWLITTPVQYVEQSFQVNQKILKSKSLPRLESWSWSVSFVPNLVERSRDGRLYYAPSFVSIRPEWFRVFHPFLCLSQVFFYCWILKMQDSSRRAFHMVQGQGNVLPTHLEVHLVLVCASRVHTTFLM